MISKHISYKEGVYSNIATRRGIDNTPNSEQLDNMELVAEKVFEPLREWVGGPIKINSFFRCPKLNKAIGGSGTIDMSLFKATLTRNSTTAVTPVLLKNTQFTALGNTKLEDFAEDSFSVTFSAGDVIYTAVKGSTNNKLWYLDSTLEVEWT